MDRYLSEEAIAKERLSGLAALAKFAWGMALIDPLCGDDIIADLCSDIEAIVDREVKRTQAEAQAAADAKAKAFWTDRISGVHIRTTKLIADIAAASWQDGIRPDGYYVYLLWETKGAEKPIYVGRSINVFSRLGQHMYDPLKRWRVAWVTMLDCASEQAMIDTEEKLITHYQPEFNIIGNSRYHV